MLGYHKVNRRGGTNRDLCSLGGWANWSLPELPAAYGPLRGFLWHWPIKSPSGEQLALLTVPKPVNPVSETNLDRNSIENGREGATG